MKILDKSYPISNYLSPANELKFESCVSEDLLRIEKYDIEIVKGLDGITHLVNKCTRKCSQICY